MSEKNASQLRKALVEFGLGSATPTQAELPEKEVTDPDLQEEVQPSGLIAVSPTPGLYRSLETLTRIEFTARCGKVRVV